MRQIVVDSHQTDDIPATPYHRARFEGDEGIFLDVCPDASGRLLMEVYAKSSLTVDEAKGLIALLTHAVDNLMS